MNAARKTGSFNRGTMSRRAEAVSALHFILMFLAAALLVLSRIDHPIASGLEKTGRQVFEPVLSALNDLIAPVRRFSSNSARFFTVESEIRALERELTSLRHLLKQASDLERKNLELGKLVNLVRTAPVDAITVEVIGGPQGPFGRTVRIAAGHRDGLRYGQPVFMGEGLFGRIVSVSETLAQVLVLNDENSRIPVEVGRRQEPAVMVGDGTAMPRLLYLRPSSVLVTGDVVTTSGASGEFPRGIRVGTIASTDEHVRVQPASELIAGSYVTVLKYNLPSASQRARAAGISRELVEGGPVPRSEGAEQ